MDAKWSENTSLKKSGVGFTVEAVRWNDEKCSNVYVYIYPRHPLFLSLSPGKEEMFSCPVPMQGVSFFEINRTEKGVITSYKWGNDYDHLWHEGMDGDYKWSQAKYEAENLFNFLDTPKESPDGKA